MFIIYLTSDELTMFLAVGRRKSMGLIDHAQWEKEVIRMFANPRPPGRDGTAGESVQLKPGFTWDLNAYALTINPDK